VFLLLAPGASSARLEYQSDEYSFSRVIRENLSTTHGPANQTDGIRASVVVAFFLICIPRGRNTIGPPPLEKS